MKINLENNNRLGIFVFFDKDGIVDDYVTYLLDDLLSTSYIPNEIYMQGIFRPVSSHASLSLMMQTITEYGVDSNEGIIAAILQGGSDTTIYVMGLYFGVIGIKKTRHAYKIGILCDIICFVICLIIYLYIL